MTPVRLEPAAPRSRVKHSTTEPLRSLELIDFLQLGSALILKTQIHIQYGCEQLVKTYDLTSIYVMRLPRKFRQVFLTFLFVSHQFKSTSHKELYVLGHHWHTSETFRWRADDDPLLVVFGSPHQLKQKTLSRLDPL